MPEEHIIRTYHLPIHVIFNLLQEIKNDLEPSSGVTQYQGSQKIFGLRFFSTYRGFFFSLFFIWDYAN